MGDYLLDTLLPALAARGPVAVSASESASLLLVAPAGLHPAPVIISAPGPGILRIWSPVLAGCPLELRADAAVALARRAGARDVAMSLDDDGDAIVSVRVPARETAEPVVVMLEHVLVELATLGPELDAALARRPQFARRRTRVERQLTQILARAG